jgi:PAS domain S-box-containing protein
VVRDPRDEEHRLAVLKEAVENTNEAFVTIDRHHRVVFFNKAAERIFGYDRAEVLGRDLDVIMSPTCSSNHRAAVDRYIRTMVPTLIGHGTEIAAVRKNGESFPANISFSVSRMGGEIYFTGIVRDLTETKELQELVRKSERLAAMGQLVAEITHEIRNPLMIVGGFARQLIRELEEDGTKRKKLHIIVDEMGRLEQLLNDLRDLYLPRRVALREIDITRLIREIGDLARPECERRGIRLQVEIPDEPMMVQGDEARLKEVLLNLVRNAIDAMEGGGTIGVGARRLREQIEITVSDEGRGIPLEHQARIFTPFFTTKPHGTGLGLSICKRIIEEHPGGALTFESEPGEGSTFRMTMVSRSDWRQGEENETV